MLYFLTIRKFKVKEYVSPKELDAVLLTLQQLYSIIPKEKGAEIDPKYHQLHAHCIMSSTNKIRYKNLSRIGPFRLFWKEIKTQHDYKKISNYIKKNAYNQYKQEEILIRNYYNHHMGFSPDGVGITE